MRERWIVYAMLPLLLGAVLFVAAAALEPPHRTDERFLFPIPEGTADKVAAGQNIDDVLPPRITTTVGVELVVQNDDNANHIFGPFLLTPGQSWHQRFAMAGDYPMVCSLYPTDFVVSVLPPEGEGAAAGAHRVWFVGWAALCALTAGVLGFSATALGRRESQSTPEAEAANGIELPDLVVYCCVSLPGATLILVALHALALSRVSPWQAALSSRALPYWMAATFAALVVAALPWLAGQFIDAWLAAGGAFGLVALVLAVGAWPTMGTEASALALVMLGAGVLGASLVAWLGLPKHGVRVHAESVGPLAIAGFAMVLGGLPWPALGSTIQLLRFAIVTVLALYIGILAYRAGRGLDRGLALVLAISATLLAVHAVGLAWFGRQG